MDALFSAHLFFKAATMAALPALLSLVLALGVVITATGVDSPRTLAHLAFWARAILRRADAEIFRFVEAGGAVEAAGVLPPAKCARSSAIWVSIRAFWASNPSIAAMMISGVSRSGMIWLSNE